MSSRCLRIDATDPAASRALSSSLASSASSSSVSASEIARTWLSQPPTICSSVFLLLRRLCAFF
jgi:hypothetical protein